ncbi:hypothetical protein BGX34_009420 [Mortierella sp. NVP85]|nr:hypothetical protein BGX34_009420 [Mortierella sp. NVP85]
MKYTNPLEIPEIADMVASYLGSKDLARCVRVCKTWHNMFLPRQWRVIEVEFKNRKDALGNDAHFGPDRESVYKHRHLIQDLSLVSTLGGLDKYDYPKVRCFSVRMLRSKASSKPKRIAMDFTKSTPMLVSLSMTAVYTKKVFWKRLSEHPHLRTLSLMSMQVTSRASPWLWKTCVNLESLMMNHVKFEDGGGPSNEVFIRMRQLDISGTTTIQDEQYQLDLILQSPMLKSLVLEAESLTTLKERSLNRHWPHLSELFVYTMDHRAENLAYILKDMGSGLGGLVEFGTNCFMETQSSNALSLHFSTLVRVEFTYGCDSSVILDVLCSCPRLEVLRAGHVSARDIAERGPWACKQLRELEIWFRYAESEQDLQQVVFERLSTLVQLECLDMKYEGSSYEEDDFGLELRLDRGLGRLASLKQLMSLDFSSDSDDDSSPELTVEDVRWMVENWGNLKRISGRLNSDKVVAAQLKKIIKSYGITTW